jgi:hypothetical protein
MPRIGTKGAELDLLIRQGATFGPINATLRNPDNSPMNLTGSLIRSQVRKTPTSPLVEGCVASFDITDPTNGQFNWWFESDVTALLVADNESENAPASTYVWDMELEDSNGRVIPLLYGKVNVFREVTKGGV